MDRGALKMRGIHEDFGSLQESFMIKVIENEKKIRYYESMIIALSSMGADPNKISDIMEEYASILWPEIENERDGFRDRAIEKFKKFSGKPFMVRPTSEESAEIVRDE